MTPDTLVERLRRMASELQRYAALTYIIPLLQEAADALQEREKDAARYRWLRDTGAVFTTRVRGVDGELCEVVDIGRPATGLDAAIDSAMGKPPGA